MPSDSEALRAWRDGDMAQGDRLFRAHAPAIYRFFRSKVDSSVDDLVQETFERCLQSSASFHEGAAFRPWLFGCARHVLHDFLRKHYRGSERLDPSLHSVMDTATTPSRAVGRRREHALLLGAMLRLPIDHQVALELYYWEGMSGAEIAAALECPEGTVRTYLRRGRLRLREELDKAAESPEEARAILADFEHWVKQTASTC